MIIHMNTPHVLPSSMSCLQRDYCCRALSGEGVTLSRFSGGRVDYMGPKVS